jgi:threonyl-tRNA synthetase
MKILSIHSDYINIEAKKKAISNAEEIKDSKLSMEECLVIFCAAEKEDEKNPEDVAKNLSKEIKDIANKLEIERIVLYPYVHLSSNPSNPKIALQILKLSESELKKNYEIMRAPFGWYKGFEIKCKGHPLSELSRSFSAAEEDNNESQALKEEKKIKSHWHILGVDGKLYDFEDFDFKEHKKLQIFSGYEREKVRASEREPLHIQAMKKLELVDNEPGSDGGNLRYYPKGRLIKSLIERFVNQKVIDYGGVEVETPIMYDMEHPCLKAYLNRFPARQYQIQSDNRNFFLRFAACFGQFLMAKDAQISYKHLPLKLYEMTRYSFRREQSGELAGLRRLRAFTMPDCHALCQDMKQAMEEFKVRFKLCMDIHKAFDLGKEDFELAIRVTKDFYKENEEFIKNFVKSFGKPALIEMWDERVFYFVMKYELNFVDGLNKASALSTDQIDVENGKQYGIEFMDSDGKKKNPLILHLSPSGAIERVMYAILEQQMMEEKKGNISQLPLWLCPSQIRVIPIAERHNEYAKKLVENFRSQKIRADLDDRESSLSKRIRNAELEWVPYVLVIGDKEEQEGMLSVRKRGNKEQEEISYNKLVEEIQGRIKEMPFQQLPLPMELSKRPIFVG